MIRTTLALSVAASLAACAANEPVTPVPTAAVVTPPAVVIATPTPNTPQAGPVTVPPGTVVAAVPALRAGMARVESVTPVDAGGTGTGGATVGTDSPGSVPPGASAATGSHRLALRMDDGSLQYVETRARPPVGERVEITADGHITYPVPRSR